MPGIREHDLLVIVDLFYSTDFVDLMEEQCTRQLAYVMSHGSGRHETKLWREEAFRTFRYALFLRYYALLEAQLRDLCNHFADELSLPFRIKDLSGSFLDRADRFITRQTTARPFHDHPSWSELTNYSKLRHLLIHADGWVRSKSDVASDLLQYIEGTRSLHINRFGRVCLRKPFCYRVVRHIRRFLTDVSSCPERLP